MPQDESLKTPMPVPLKIPDPVLPVNTTHAHTKIYQYLIFGVVCLVLIVLLAPIPHYSSEPALCKQGPCPSYLGWQLLPSLGSGIWSAITQSSRVAIDTNIPSPTAPSDPTAGWKTYTDKENRFEFKYPPTLDSLVTSKQFHISIKNKTQILNEYQVYKQSGGCPSTCGALSENSELLNKQFQLLSIVGSQSQCTIPTNTLPEIKNDFILFTSGIGNKLIISTIKINAMPCGIKIIESDGFDASIDNYFYKVGLLVDDKVVEIFFPIFPHAAFPSVDNLWNSFGFDLTEKACNADCDEQQVKFMQNLHEDNPIMLEVITTYDQILSTFKLIDQGSPTTTCTPRPPCLDATPQCMIPETSDMCPRSKPTSPMSYVCPSSGWVDCMPGTDAKPECSTEAMNWYKTNCPNFQGGAL